MEKFALCWLKTNNSKVKPILVLSKETLDICSSFLAENSQIDVDHTKGEFNLTS